MGVLLILGACLHGPLSSGLSFAKIIEPKSAVQVLRKDLIGHRTDLLESVYYPVNRFELSFYRNNVIHLFVPEGKIDFCEIEI